jgi:hypothetical protein
MRAVLRNHLESAARLFQDELLGQLRSSVAEDNFTSSAIMGLNGP